MIEKLTLTYQFNYIYWHVLTKASGRIFSVLRAAPLRNHLSTYIHYSNFPPARQLYLSSTFQRQGNLKELYVRHKRYVGEKKKHKGM